MSPYSYTVFTDKDSEVKHQLESPMLPDPFQTYLGKHLKASDLLKRLKVKIVSDPLIDKNGKHVKEDSVLW